MRNPGGWWFRISLFGLAALACSYASAENRASGYSYEMVELATNGASIEDPNKPYRDLWAATSQRAAKEALIGSEVKTAFQGATYFGAKSDSYMVYAITPERGVFYYLPPGPYAPSGGAILTMSNTIEACRLEITWSEIDHTDSLSDMILLDFVSKDCIPFETDVAGAEEVTQRQELSIKKLSIETGHSVSLVSSNMRSGRFNTAQALAEVLDADGRKLKNTIPLAGMDENGLIAGVSDNGSVYIVIESTWLPYNKRCVLAGGEWATVSDRRLRSLAERACKREAGRK